MAHKCHGKTLLLTANILLFTTNLLLFTAKLSVTNSKTYENKTEAAAFLCKIQDGVRRCEEEYCFKLTLNVVSIWCWIAPTKHNADDQIDDNDYNDSTDNNGELSTFNIF